MAESTGGAGCLTIAAGRIEITRGEEWVQISERYPAFAAVVDGESRYGSPAVIVDAALADRQLAAHISGIDLFNGNEPFMRFRDDINAWEVGVLDYNTELITRVLVDPLTAEVIGRLETRAWDYDRDGMP